MLAVFGPVTAYTLNAAIAHVQSCGTETTLTVAAAPELAPVLEEFVDAGGGAPEKGSDVCAEIDVTAAEGTEIDEVDADVWIPETGLWLHIPERDLDEQWDVLNTSTASSAVGLALPEGESTDQVTPDGVEVSLENPREDPASLKWMVLFGVTEDSASGASDDAYEVMSAAQVRRLNEQEGAGLQEPIGPAQVGQFEYPMLIDADLDDDRREAANNLLRSYGLPEYPEILSASGFGPSVPQPPEQSASAVEAVLQAWDAYSSGG